MGIWEKFLKLFAAPPEIIYNRNTADRFSYIQVPIHVNGERLLFLLDTGATISVISAAAVLRLKLPCFGSVILAGIGGKVETRFAGVDSFKVGDIEEKHIRLPIDLHPDPRSLDGILGMDFITRYIVTIEWQKKKVTLRSYPQEKEGGSQNSPT